MDRVPTIRGVRGTAVAPSVQGWVLPHLIAWVEARGADATSIRALPGMADLADPDVRLPEGSVEAAWRLAGELTGSDAIGVRVAASLPRGALDLIEYALRASPSLAAGLGRLARYGRLISDRVAARTDAHGQGLLFLLRDTAGTALHPGRAEFGLALAVQLARDAAGADIVPVRVSFAHPAPARVAEHERFFRAPVAFAAGSNSLVFSAADAARPMIAADAALAAIVARRLDKALGERELGEPGTLAERVRRLVVDHLGETMLTPVTVARSLAVSRRTLSRHLADEGTSFRQILDDVRKEYACALLRDRSLSVGEIAFFLQYSEPAAFNRSFRRWTGLSPRAFRDA